jgi:hypothetical protein
MEDETMSASQIQGFTTSNIAEVEQSTKALRTTLRAEDYGSLGMYSIAATSGVMAAGFTVGAATAIWSLRWGNASNLALIKRIMLSAGNGSTAFAAGIFAVSLFRATSFSASDTGGTSILPNSTSNRLRSSMGSSLLTDIRIASTAALGTGTRTLDNSAIGAASCAVPAVAGSKLLEFIPIWDTRPGEHPIVLATNEGLLLIPTSVPATGTWSFSVKVDYTEIAAY